MSIRNKSFIYHLTSVQNIPSIFQTGLQPRSALDPDIFRDVADAEIIEGRMGSSLEDFVPFHWFARNPFDGRVQMDRPDEDFVLIAVNRSHARDQNWTIIPRHPLAAGQVELMEYAAGIQAIDWDLMDLRDYSDTACRHVCMAECLSLGEVPVGHFAKIFTPDERVKRIVLGHAREYGHHRLWVEANSNMFSNR